MFDYFIHSLCTVLSKSKNVNTISIYLLIEGIHINSILFSSRSGKFMALYPGALDEGMLTYRCMALRVSHWRATVER